MENARNEGDRTAFAILPKIRRGFGYGGDGGAGRKHDGDKREGKQQAAHRESFHLRAAKHIHCSTQFGITVDEFGIRG